MRPSAYSLPKRRIASEKLEMLLLKEITQDWKALWQIAAVMRDEFTLEASNFELGIMMLPTMLDFLNRGLIKFGRRLWSHIDYLPIASSEVETLLRDHNHWSFSEDKNYLQFWCAATELGNHVHALHCQSFK